MVRKYRSVAAPTEAEFERMKAVFEGAIRSKLPAPAAEAPKPLTFAERRRGDTEPVWDISLNEMNLLGEHKGRKWYTAPARIGQLADAEFEALPSIVQADWTDQRAPGLWVVMPGGETYFATRRHPSGTFAKLTAPKDAKSEDETFAPVDHLDEHWRFLGWPGSFNVPTLLVRARKAGVLVGMDEARTRTVRWYEGGRPLGIGNKIVNLLDDAEPLVVADMTGVPVLCAIEGCRPEPHAAETVTDTGVLWCRQEPELAPKGARPEAVQPSRVGKLRAAVGLA